MTHTFVICPDCGSRLSFIDDDEREVMFYRCSGCFSDWTLEGERIGERVPRADLERTFQPILDQIAEDGI